MNSSVLLHRLASVRRKLVAAFSETHQPQIKVYAETDTHRQAGVAAGAGVLPSTARRALTIDAEAF